MSNHFMFQQYLIQKCQICVLIILVLLSSTQSFRSYWIKGHLTLSSTFFKSSRVFDSDTVQQLDSNNNKDWMFFDVAKVHCKGGDGGDGCRAMRRELRVALGGPSGGNGGNGGSVYLQCDENLNTLSRLRRKVHYRADDGSNGKGDSRHGFKGDDCFVFVPPGTIVRDEHGKLAGELNNHGAKMLIARGGKGGRGNEYFKTSRVNAPNFAEKGEPGVERWINIELKLIADIGLVGVPNAGKSSLLASISNAKPKIADYPFTTVVPNLGVCDLVENSAGSLVVADIPGLLEGAHEGIGLGSAFLRHIQRCRLLIHVVNGDSLDPVGDFTAINQELALFNPKLANKTQVIAVNKIDIPSVNQKLSDTVSALRAAAGHRRIMGISAVTGENVKTMMMKTSKLLSLLPQSSINLFTEEEECVSFDDHNSGDFQIVVDETRATKFHIVGIEIEQIVAMTNWDYYEAVQRFHRILEARGINAALRKAGAKPGDTVVIGDLEFNFLDNSQKWVADLGFNG